MAEYCFSLQELCHSDGSGGIPFGPNPNLCACQGCICPSTDNICISRVSTFFLLLLLFMCYCAVATVVVLLPCFACCVVAVATVLFCCCHLCCCAVATVLLCCCHCVVVLLPLYFCVLPLCCFLLLECCLCYYPCTMTVNCKLTGIDACLMHFFWLLAIVQVCYTPQATSCHSDIFTSFPKGGDKSLCP